MSHVIFVKNYHLVLPPLLLTTFLIRSSIESMNLSSFSTSRGSRIPCTHFLMSSKALISWILFCRVSFIIFHTFSVGFRSSVAPAIRSSPQGAVLFAHFQYCSSGSGRHSPQISHRLLFARSGIVNHHTPDPRNQHHYAYFVHNDQL